ncbi:CRISPR-associated endonuclease Cas1 [Methanoregula sp.]|uniref:CRISPR-associated endonuclease Cas1 n=1 Tax=Methanoregula sp. TaxID=2052170 RepID=UPI003C71490D
MAEYPWVSVSGFGTHIKSTQNHLVLQNKSNTDRIPLESIKHLLVIGSHTLSTTTVLRLLKNGTYVTFFEPDGTPVGIITPFGDRSRAENYRTQQMIPRHRYAITIAQAALKSRIFAIERAQELQNVHLFYEGELDVLMKSHDEFAYLIKLEEIRRLHKLTSDMYYEIMSRNLPMDFRFRRRTMRPHIDPINALLSFGYAMLFGNCCVSVIGSGLDPDTGFMHEGNGSLVYDLIDPLKVEMVDSVIFDVARNSLTVADFEITPDRCLLSDELIGTLAKKFHATIQDKKINEWVFHLFASIKNGSEFKIMY